MFQSITLKQLNSLTTINRLSCLVGLEVMHQTAMLEVLGSFYGSDNAVYVCFVVVLS